MKKVRTLILFTAALGFSVNAHAQIEKGKWVAGASFHLMTNNGELEQFNENTKLNDLRTAVSFGNMLNNKVLLGVGLSYGRQYRKVELNLNSFRISESETYGVDVYTKYFHKVYNKLYYAPFVNVSLEKIEGSYQRRDLGLQDAESTNSSKGLIISVAPIQMNYTLTKRILLQAGFGVVEYGYLKGEDNVNGEGHSSGFNISFSPNISNIGISVIL